MDTINSNRSQNDPLAEGSSPVFSPIQNRPDRGLRFALILFSICVALFLSALELTAVSTALPTIVKELGGINFLWVGAAYALSSTAILPMTAGISQLFGRRPAVLGSIAFFALGSAICGAAKDMSMLIAGRTIQGIGGGGILSLSLIVLGDLVPLKERGLYAGLFGLTWSIAAALGPVVGGSLANSGQWRWLFYLNLPLCGFSGILTALYLHLPIPPGTIREKLSRMDWIGNFVVVTATCSTTVALTEGGVNAPWQSARILPPLIIGLLGLAIFMVYESIWASDPLVPILILSNRTSFSGYAQTFFNALTTVATIYYVPVYFQACKDANPMMGGVFTLGLATIAPAAIMGGASVKLLKRYRPQLWMAWTLQLIGMSLMTLVSLESSTSMMVGFCVLFGLGAGMNYSTQFFPIQAPLPLSTNAHALAFVAFLRSFAAVWGVSISGAILQNELQRVLPQPFLDQLPGGASMVYSVIPTIKDLPQPLKDEVRKAFIDSLRVVWNIMAGVCGLALLSTFLMKGLPLHTSTDENWDLEGKGEMNREQRDTT